MGFRPRTQELEIENIVEGQEEKNEKFKEGSCFLTIFYFSAVFFTKKK